MSVFVVFDFKNIIIKQYIVNKHTTAKNVELLDYVNAKKKRVDLSDMVEFFDGGTRRTIRNISPTMKYAEGGQLPLLNSDITINDRLLMMMDKYSNRPVVVSVTEINDVRNKRNMMNMNKKEYMIPTCEVVEMETSVSILSGSTPKVDVELGDDLEYGTTETNRHRGEWGNLWSNIK